MDLHGQIMNIQGKPGMHAMTDSTRIAYAEGHRDARHAAAELALAVEAEKNRLAAALRAIADLHPDKDSEEGFNEWGEADCFNQAQTLARAALVSG